MSYSLNSFTGGYVGDNKGFRVSDLGFRVQGLEFGVI